jgi:hypothetical protein
MGGLLVLIAIALWGWFSLWLGKLISRWFARFTFNKETGKTNLWHAPVKVLCIAFVFLLPFMDQLIAWPKWQQMCATTGDFEWGPGMDEKKAFGRDVVVVNERVTTTTIFPNIKIDYLGQYIYDAKTQELIFKKPHYSYEAKGMFYIPSDSGDKAALFLQSCENYKFMTKEDSLMKTLQLNQLEKKAVLK